MKTRAAECWVIAILSVGAIFFMNQTQNLPSATLPGGIGPRAFPIITFWMILILNTFLMASIIWNELRGKKAVSTERESQIRLIWKIIPYIPHQVLGIIVMCLLFVFFWQYFGFSLAAFLSVFGGSLFLAPKGRHLILHSLIVAGFFALIIYILFVYVFKVAL